MKNKAFFKTLIYVMIALFFGFIAIFESAYLNVQAEETNAETTYSDVLEDLQKDETFNATKYPVNEKDYSMELITIAEGKHTEIFVYVYQPSYITTSYVATSINISTTVNAQLNYVNYKLRLINTNGVFQKYAIENLYVNADNIRFYDISSIFREYNDVTDKPWGSTNENTVIEVAFPVSKLFTFESVGGYDFVKVEDTETIKITDKYVGFIRYEAFGNGVMGNDYYDSHFVAFSTDRQIDELLEADVYYQEQSYYYKEMMGIKTNDDISSAENKYAYLRCDQTGGYDPGYWFSDTIYEWPRISTMYDFCHEVDRELLFEGGIIDVKDRVKMSDEAFINLAGKQWILRFVETEYSSLVYSDVYTESYSIISNVSILRLKFKTNDMVYNLGVVDNKQSGDLIPDGENDPELELDLTAIRNLFNDMLTIFMICVVVGIFFVVLLPFWPAIANAIISALKWLWDGLCWLLLFPFNLIGKWFNKKNK